MATKYFTLAEASGYAKQSKYNLKKAIMSNKLIAETVAGVKGKEFRILDSDLNYYLQTLGDDMVKKGKIIKDEKQDNENIVKPYNVFTLDNDKVQQLENKILLLEVENKELLNRYHQVVDKNLEVTTQLLALAGANTQSPRRKFLGIF